MHASHFLLLILALSCGTHKKGGNTNNGAPAGQGVNQPTLSKPAGQSPSVTMPPAPSPVAGPSTPGTCAPNDPLCFFSIRAGDDVATLIRKLGEPLRRVPGEGLEHFQWSPSGCVTGAYAADSLFFTIQLDPTLNCSAYEVKTFLSSRGIDTTRLREFPASSAALISARGAPAISGQGEYKYESKAGGYTISEMFRCSADRCDSWQFFWFK